MTSPTLLPDALRAAADQALALAADPINLLDDNPFIAREWSAVAIELSAAAASLERRVFSLLFAKAIDGPETRVVGRTPIRPDATAPPLLRTPSSPPGSRLGDAGDGDADRRRHDPALVPVRLGGAGAAVHGLRKLNHGSLTTM